MKLILLIFFALGLWALFGSPQKDITNWFWPETAAPWEQVDAYYYPSRNNLSNHLNISDVGSVQDCRDKVYAMAADENDPALRRGDYECGVGELNSFAGMTVYRISVR